MDSTDMLEALLDGHNVAADQAASLMTMLVGTSLMRSADPAAAVRALCMAGR